MKKFAVVFMCIALVLSLTACGKSAQDKGASAGNSNSQTSGQKENADNGEHGSENTAEPNVSSDGKTLVVYFSATGNTQRVAKSVASAAGADIFEIVPTSVYTDDDLDWTNQDSRVSREHDDESLRNVPLIETTVPQWDTYDTVFIGYPIWWGIAAWPVDGFVKANDFTNKTVIPFCTSSSSDIGESGALLAEISGSGNWLDGQRFSSSASEQTVSDWVESLGL